MLQNTRDVLFRHGRERRHDPNNQERVIKRNDNKKRYRMTRSSTLSRYGVMEMLKERVRKDERVKLSIVYITDAIREAFVLQRDQGQTMGWYQRRTLAAISSRTL